MPVHYGLTTSLKDRLRLQDAQVVLQRPPEADDTMDLGLREVAERVEACPGAQKW